jgi:type IV pilus assembly protein PilE
MKPMHALPHPRPRRLRRGFGLVETVTAVAIVGVLATVALPSYRDAQLRSRRVDATQALQRLQAAQEQYRLSHGRYAESLAQLPGTDNAVSPLGRYRIGMRLVGNDGYELVAQAHEAQAADRACPAFTLRVSGNFSTQGPDTGCWPA